MLLVVEFVRKLFENIQIIVVISINKSGTKHPANLKEFYTMEKKLLTTKELSERWNGSPTPDTLRQWRSKKKGPQYVKLGGVRYRLSDIVEYEESLKSC